jgi:rhodanese-related sulfurtransferase
VPTAIDREQVKKLIANRAQLVDTLPAEEYRDEHIPGAIHLPLRKIDDGQALKILDPARPVIVYCWDSA